MYPYFGYYPMRIDPTMIILIPAILFTIYAQFKVTSTTSRYLKVRSQRGFTGEHVARKILDDNGLYNVRIEMVRGHLSDHYDPRGKVVRLSQDIYYGNSITSVSVAAHECGHAIQHHVGYAPLKLRSVSVPVANFGSKLSWPLILIGLLLGSTGLAKLGVILFLFVVFFQVVTLPVEFNASRRALVTLGNTQILTEDEVKKARKVLSAAALTYVAAMAQAVANLLRLLLIVGGRRRDD